MFWKVIFALIPPPVRRFKGEASGVEIDTPGGGVIYYPKKNGGIRWGMPCAFCAFFIFGNFKLHQIVLAVFFCWAKRFEIHFWLDLFE